MRQPPPGLLPGGLQKFPYGAVPVGENGPDPPVVVLTVHRGLHVSSRKEGAENLGFFSRIEAVHEGPPLRRSGDRPPAVNMHCHPLLGRKPGGEDQRAGCGLYDGEDALPLFGGDLHIRPEGGNPFFQQGGLHIEGRRHCPPLGGSELAPVFEGKGNTRQKGTFKGEAEGVDCPEDGLPSRDRPGEIVDARGNKVIVQRSLHKVFFTRRKGKPPGLEQAGDEGVFAHGLRPLRRRKKEKGQDKECDENFEENGRRFMKVTHYGISLKEKQHSGVVYQTPRGGLS
ncbi:hypothetical protein MASR2M79_20210 [Aminivibrio sp.]